ncbi:putative membrane-associating domain containing protein [Lyophyllum shimeji]|uniref:Membrane-associating domain containing protein n=1 Tax=Lyophyllum shimeji TaxID=47721 RepID=A0A9P3UMP0_LYOSH|nr:putative membrane-associating domain containing protein [Lyophyllum shimeji]
MGVLDKITGLASRLGPSQTTKPAGIGHGHGMVMDDNMIVSKPAIVFHSSQIFFNFLAMACYASVASFQAKWKVGPSGLSGFALFISIAGMFLSTFMMMVPVVYEKYDKAVRLARALKEVRVGFILTGVGTVASLLIAFIVTISAWTQPGCKNPDNDPHKDLGDDFKKGLDGFCSTKKAAAIFFWLAFGFWLASLILLILDWRSGKLHTGHAGPRDPPFTRPEMTQDLEDGLAEEEEEEDQNDGYARVPRPNSYAPSSNSHPSRYDNTFAAAPAAGSPFGDENRYNPPGSSNAPPSSYAAGRPSMDAYGAFSDPAPSGFASSTMQQQQQVQEPPRMSRTMQYADPYAAVRASIAGGGHGGQSVPPSYESYQGYR